MSLMLYCVSCCDSVEFRPQLPFSFSLQTGLQLHFIKVQSILLCLPSSCFSVHKDRLQLCLSETRLQIHQARVTIFVSKHQKMANKCSDFQLSSLNATTLQNIYSLFYNELVLSQLFISLKRKKNTPKESKHVQLLQEKLCPLALKDCQE